MSPVHILSPDVIAKIAAGEVVDRPSSVIKELLENALDAKSTSIQIQLLDGGKKSIIIKDNGSGIASDDLETIFLRHATSKIESADDLFAINSLGFRGEALYSIAAISDIRLKSKTAEQETGYEIHIRGGEKISHKPCAMNSCGTEMEVRELFFNTPARKSFLKTDASEYHAIMQVVVPYALLYPNIHMMLSHQNRDTLHVTATDDLKDRIAHVLNLKAEHIIEKQEDFPNEKLKVRMILGDINIKRARRDLQYLFVNDRPVYNKNIAFHINQIYRLIMPGNEFPFFCLYLDVPAQEVDVNIHPTKREVKLKKEREICSLLRRVTERALMGSGMKTVQDRFERRSHFNIFPKPSSAAETFETQTPDTLFESGPNSSKEAANKDYAYPQNTQSSFYLPETELADQPSLQKKLTNARYVGTFIDKYVLFESDTSLLLMDQHAAAERVTYEMLIRQMEKGSVEIQPLLDPILVDVTPQEMVIWEQMQEEFKKVGLESSAFDKQTIAIHTQPALLKDVSLTARYLLAGEKVTVRDHDQIARRACRSSIMTGDHLHSEQIEHLRKDLLNCLDPFTCPHGRPTVVEMSEEFLDKQFLRS